MNNDGKVVIGTELETKQLQKQLKELQTDLKKLQQEEDKLFGEKSKYETTLNGYRAEQREIKNTTLKLQKYNNQLEEIKRKREEMFGAGASVAEVNAAGYGPKEINEIMAKRSVVYEKLPYMGHEEVTNRKLQETRSELSRINKQIEDNATKQNDVNQKIIEMNNELNKAKGFNNIQKSIEGIGSSVSGVIKKVGKWALAVFSIRSAYTLVRQAVSTLSQYNEQIATDIEYVRFAIATTLQPVIEAIIRLVYQLLGLINSIAKAWFGVDLFANASVNAFNRNKKAIAGVNKNAKELQKTLAGFDKANILQEDGSTAVGGGGGGVLTPSIDLSQIGSTDLGAVDTFLDKIKDKFNEVFTNIKNNIIKVLSELGFSETFTNIFGGLFEGFRKAINGLFEFIRGVANVIVGFVTGDTEKVKKGITQAINGLWELIKGLFEYAINMMFILPGLVLELAKNIAKYVYDVVIVPIGDWFRQLPDNITSWISNGVRNVNAWFEKIPEKVRQVKDRVVDFFRNMGTDVGYAIGNAFKSVINAVLNRVETTLNKPINAINSLLGVINGIPGINIGKLSTIKLPRMAQGGILNMPGRGVMVGSAIVGERGREGVVPLDNEASLKIIGETIAKHTKLNADITLELEGRILARVMQEINSDRRFARNGG